jgi:hypothetical protein
MPASLRSPGRPIIFRLLVEKTVVRLWVSAHIERRANLRCTTDVDLDQRCLRRIGGSKLALVRASFRPSMRLCCRSRPVPISTDGLRHCLNACRLDMRLYHG